MEAIQTEVLVIGGGATGLGVVRDAALRGYDTVLLERVDLGQGTTGRFHGLLHSGGRYVTRDVEAGKECALERDVLSRIVPDAIEETGGFFVTTPVDDPDYADAFARGCVDAGVWVEEIEPALAIAEEPRLNPRISRAFRVKDGAVDAWKLLWANARSAQQHGARILTYHWVTSILREDDAVTGVIARNDLTGEEVRIDAAFTINASGAWAGEIATMAGAEGVTVVPGKGIMIAMNHRLVNTVINRCDPPGDGDILVPVRTVSVIGTTDTEARNPDDLEITHDEVQRMLDAGEVLVPGFRNTRALHVWAGARPLFKDERADQSLDTRHMSRGMALVDHQRRDGLRRFLTITGGKFTTYRLMAEVVVNAMCEQLGEDRPCTTATTPMPVSAEDGATRVGARLARRERNLHDEKVVCECELVTRGLMVQEIDRKPLGNLDDLRRVLRLGMGPCQGGYCAHRATALVHERTDVSAGRAHELLHRFYDYRWLGLKPILYGDQVRQAVLDEWIINGTLDLEHLPREVSR
ncbi:MAG: anaerobic glycerol-3-phosphate dehydrogenase subunit GlpA [Thermoleophilia bacterium]